MGQKSRFSYGSVMKKSRILLSFHLLLFGIITFYSTSRAMQLSGAPAQHQRKRNRQSEILPAAWYAVYADPIFGTPIKVRYTPTKQEILDHDIRHFLHRRPQMAQNQNSAERALGNAQHTADHAALLARTLMHGTQQQAAALLEANADPNRPDSSGALPLHTATYYTNMDVLPLLIAAKADIHAPDKNGNTVLHVAAHKENLALVSVLLAAGANPESRDQSGLTALEYILSRKKVYEDMRENIICDSEKFAHENGEPLPTFQAIMENLQDKLDALYTICAALERTQEQIQQNS